MGFWKGLIIEQAQEWTYAQLSPSQVPDEPRTSEEIVPNKGYLTIRLRSMRIVNVRKWTSKFYGVVHSFVTLNHTSGIDSSFQTVITPTQLGTIDPEHLDRVITKDIPLVGPVPYRGEKVGLELGLFSVKESDLAVPYIELLEIMASKAGVSAMSAALPFVEPLKKGIDAIIGTSASTILEIGVSTTFNPPKTGWFMVMRAPKGANIASTLKVTENDYRLVDAVSGQGVEDYPYLVFTIQQSKERHDWYKLAYLKDTYEQLRTALRSGKETEAEELLKVFKRVALTNNDLLYEDAKRIGRLVEEELGNILKATLHHAGDIKQLPPLESYPLYSN